MSHRKKKGKVVENNTEKQWENPKTLLSIVENTDEFHSPGSPKPSHQSRGPTCLGGVFTAKSNLKVAIKCGVLTYVLVDFLIYMFASKCLLLQQRFQVFLAKLQWNTDFGGAKIKKLTAFGRSTKFHVLSP